VWLHVVCDYLVDWLERSVSGSACYMCLRAVCVCVWGGGYLRGLASCVIFALILWLPVFSYYWDTYFTCLGLISTGRLQWCIDLAENLAHLIHTVGHIPNGNREYYRPRSQPPFFSHILELLESKLGTAPVAEKYVQSLEMEYRWWMRGEDKLTPHRPAVGRVVRVVCDEGDDGEVVTMNRYNDNSYCTPREESYREDVEIAHHAEIEPQDLHSFYRHIRAAAESGWDFSSRWFADK